MSQSRERNPNLRELRSRPVCIICGRPAEAEGIAKALGIFENRLPGDEVEKVNDGHTFYLGSFKLQEGELEYYITSSLRQGIQSFTVNASVLFSILNPRFVVHAGVCAGFDDPDKKLKLQLKDVVFGEAAINYEEGKWEHVVDKGLLFRPDYNRVTASTGDMQAFAESRSRPQYHYGEYVSGSAVRGDAGVVFEKIRGGVNRNAIALDMEASAFIQLCEHFGNDYAKCLGIVKGISDFGNSEKGKDENTYTEALQNTALALKEWLIHRIPALNWEVDESDEPGARIVLGYYKNFVSRVLDNFCQGWPVTLKDDASVVIPRREIKGFKTVLPKAYQPAFVAEMGNIMAITDRYDIREVVIGGDQGSRTLYYKGGYLMDWSRCCNALNQCEDGVYQVGVFERMLRKNHYYAAEHGPAKASICTWEEIEAWLEKIALEEQAEKQGAESPRKEDTSNSSIRPQRPELLTAALSGTEERQHEEKATIESPRSPNTFPSALPEKSPFVKLREVSKTLPVSPEKKRSFPQLLKFFRKKASHGQLIPNEN